MNTIEFRHASWWQPVVFKTFKKEKLVFSGISYPSLPDEAVVTNPIIYYRFHGVPKLYYSAYSQAVLKQVADHIAQHEDGRQAYIFFNNTATQAAIENATWLKTYLRGE